MARDVFIWLSKIKMIEKGGGLDETSAEDLAVLDYAANLVKGETSITKHPVSFINVVNPFFLFPFKCR